jgi:hypothetical protein
MHSVLGDSVRSTAPVIKLYKYNGKALGDMIIR